MTLDVTTKIIVKGNPIEKKGFSTTVIMPGMLIEYTGGKEGEYPKIKARSTAAHATRNFAVENVDEALDYEEGYQTGQAVQYASCYRGCVVNAWVAPSAAAVALGDALAADADGTVKKHTTGLIIGYALRDVDNSGNNTSPAQILMEVS